MCCHKRLLLQAMLLVPAADAPAVELPGLGRVGECLVSPLFAEFPLTKPIWWAVHVPQWLMGALTVFAAALVWIVLLRIQVRRQTARLLAANEELGRMEKQLRQALHQERELNELKGSFVNTISHEFRTPLGIILFASSMLRRFSERFGPEERMNQLNVIDDAVKRMNDLVEQTLTLGRAEAARPEVRDLDLMAVCHRVVDEVQTATSYRCRIWLSADGSDHHGCMDEMILRTILVNLLGNAVKYSPAGSKVILRLSRQHAHAIFTVRDYGPGVPNEELQDIFNSFHRGRGATGTPGTGLGLAIVKRCAESAGGSVSARNAEGGGAEFIVRLPLTPVEDDSPTSSTFTSTSRVPALS